MILSWYSVTQSIWLRTERKMLFKSSWMYLCGKQKTKTKRTHPWPISFFLWKVLPRLQPPCHWHYLWTLQKDMAALHLHPPETRQPLRTVLRTLKLCWRSDSLHRSLPRCLLHLAAVGNINTTCKPIWRVKKITLMDLYNLHKFKFWWPCNKTIWPRLSNSGIAGGTEKWRSFS